MSKTFKDLPERIKAKMQDKGTETLKTALPKNTDESFTHEDTFIFKSADVNEIQAFKEFIEESDSKLISSEEFYGYVLEEKELTEREQALDSDNFPFLKSYKQSLLMISSRGVTLRSGRHRTPSTRLRKKSLKSPERLQALTSLPLSQQGSRLEMCSIRRPPKMNFMNSLIL